MQIKSHLKMYDVHIGEDLNFLKKLNQIQNVQFVIDSNVYEQYEQEFYEISKEKIILIDALEQNKVIDTALKICEKIAEIPAKRNAVLISVGGGIIQDITGFVANIMYRGIRWIYVPTTLLSACDSCIGGKTSLNYKRFKNLLGTFYPPDEIYISSKWFYTLSDKDFKSGLGEVVKFNIMKGKEGLGSIEEKIDDLLARDIETVNSFVNNSLTYKKTFIETDEFDKGERIKLNFAHTFGHAIEVVSEYIIPHGTAVAIGMILADTISYRRGYISEELLKRSENVLLKVIDIDIDLLKRPLQTYIEAIRKDKKQIDNSLTAVLLKQTDQGHELAVVHDMSESEVEDAISSFCQLYERERKAR